MEKITTVERSYIISIGELKKALGIEGEIHSWELQYEGRSPQKIDEGVSQDTEKIQIITRVDDK